MRIIDCVGEVGFNRIERGVAEGIAVGDEKGKKPQAEKPSVPQDEGSVSLNAEQPKAKLTETPPPAKPKP